MCSPLPPIARALVDPAITTPHRVSRQHARAAERRLIDAFVAAVARQPRLPAPGVAGKPLPAPAAPSQSDERGRLARLADRLGASSDAVAAGPQGARATARISRRGLFGVRTELVLVAGGALRLERYLRDGYDDAPIGPAELQATLERWALEPSLPHVLGLLSPTGWAPEVDAAELTSDTRRVLLIAPVASDRSLELSADADEDALAFRVESAAADAPYRPLFDPEPPTAKVERALRYLTRHPKLRPPGGVLLLAGLPARLDLPGDAFEEAVGRALAADPRLVREVVLDEPILRRLRY